MKKIKEGNEWNRLIGLRDTTTNQGVKEKAEMILRQMNTASGSVTMKKEARIFLHTHEKTTIN